MPFLLYLLYQKMCIRDREIVERSGNRFDNQYETLVSDIREFLNRSDKDISSFASAANSGDILSLIHIFMIMK